MNAMVIGIAGPSAGGKTSVTELIKEEIGKNNVVVLKYDDYYKAQDHLTFEERVKVNYDHPNAFDTDLLIQDLVALREGQNIEKPTYDFKNHTRSKKTELILAKSVIIVEGIFTLLEEDLRRLLDVKVYVYEDNDICLIRRLKRDTGERGRSIDSVIEQYTTTVKPMQEQFIEPTRKFADVIILRGKKNDVAIKMISDNIKKFLKNEQ